MSKHYIASSKPARKRRVSLFARIMQVCMIIQWMGVMFRIQDASPVTSEVQLISSVIGATTLLFVALAYWQTLDRS